VITTLRFEEWLARYGAAWRAGDPAAAVRLFTEDAAYHETPYEPPMVGHAAIARYWTEGAQQTQADVTFDATVIALVNDTGYARWQATFRRLPSNHRVELDGVLMARFVDDCCGEFREWWHRRETPAA